MVQVADCHQNALEGSCHVKLLSSRRSPRCGALLHRARETIVAYAYGVRPRRGRHSTMRDEERSMNVMTHTPRFRGRLADLSPFDPDPEESNEPQATPEHPGRERQGED